MKKEQLKELIDAQKTLSGAMGQWMSAEEALKTQEFAKFMKQNKRLEEGMNRAMTWIKSASLSGQDFIEMSANGVSQDLINLLKELGYEVVSGGDRYYVTWGEQETKIQPNAVSESHLIEIATKAYSKGWTYEDLCNSDDASDIDGDQRWKVYEYVTEAKQIGTEAFKKKYAGAAFYWQF